MQCTDETSTAQDYLWSGAQNIRAVRLPVPMVGSAVRWDVVKITSLSLSLSSPRAESPRAFTGRRSSHSGKGEDFLSCQQNFFTETAVTPERKVEKSFPRWEINRHVEG